MTTALPARDLEYATTEELLRELAVRFDSYVLAGEERHRLKSRANRVKVYMAKGSTRAKDLMAKAGEAVLNTEQVLIQPANQAKRKES